MQVVAGRQPGGAHLAQQIARRDLLPGHGVDGRHVIVAGVDAQPVVDDDRAAAHVQRLGQHDRPGRGGQHRRAAVGAEIDPFVIGQVRPAVVGASRAVVGRDLQEAVQRDAERPVP